MEENPDLDLLILMLKKEAVIKTKEDEVNFKELLAEAPVHELVQLYGKNIKF